MAKRWLRGAWFSAENIDRVFSFPTTFALGESKGSCPVRAGSDSEEATVAGSDATGSNSSSISRAVVVPVGTA